MPAITTPPSAPSRSDAPDTFNAKVDAYLAWMGTFTDEANTLAAGLSNASTNSTSTSSLTIGTGSKSLTVETGKGYVPGTLIVVAETATPSNWMYGEVTTYNSGTGALVLNVEQINGSGTASAWTVSLTGPIGSPVPQGGGIVASAVDLTLTSTSDRVQKITMSAALKSVTLPAASTLVEGGPIFILYKAGGYAFDIKTASGALIARLDRSRGVALYLVDSATDSWIALYQETAMAIGSGVIFNAANTTYNAICALDSTHVLVCYSDTGNSDVGTACVLTISGTTVTAGAEYAFNAGSTAATMSVCALSATKAVVAYSDVGNSSYLTACVLTISGTTVSAGAETVLASVVSDLSIAAATLDSTHAIVTYVDKTAAANNGKAIAISVSGTTITAGSAATFNAASTAYLSVAPLSASAAIVAYSDVGNSNRGTACVLSVSGVTVTAGAEAVFFSGTASYCSVAAFSSTSAVAAWANGTSGGQTSVLSISGTTITPQTAADFSSTSLTRTQIVAADASNVVISYRDTATSYPYALSLILNGTTMTAGLAAQNILAAQTDHPILCAPTASLAVAAMRDMTSGNVGKAVAIGV